MISVPDLAGDARTLSLHDFERRYGVVALLTRPTTEQLERAALKLDAAATVYSRHKPTLSELLLMLRGFRTLQVTFLNTGGEGQAFTVGREEGCAAVVDGPSVSKVHASLVWASGAWWVRDESSLNGTFLNGEHVGSEPKKLASGDSIGLGDTQVLFINSAALRGQLQSIPA